MPQSTYRAGYAVEVTLASGYWRATDLAEGVTIEGESYVPYGFEIKHAPSYGDAALSSMILTALNADGSITTELRANGLLKRRVRIWEMRRSSPADTLVEHLIFDGAIEQVTCGEDLAQFQLGALFAPWGVIAPPAFSSQCRYTSTVQCDYVATCNKTYNAGADNCTTNAQTAIFGGFRFLPIEGQRLEFRDSGVTIASGKIRYRGL